MCYIYYVSVILLALLGSSCGNTGYEYPLLSAEGTHYAVGHQIGLVMGSRIQQYYKDSGLLDQIFLPWYKTQIGFKIYSSFLGAANITYPCFVEELQGIADGANIPFHHVMLMNLRVELLAFIQPDSVSLQPDECTDIHVYNKKVTILAHNEDASLSVSKHSYFVNITITSTTSALTPQCAAASRKSFFAFSYPGSLPGNAFGFNEHFAITVNALYPKLVLTGAIARNFLTRALLTADDSTDIYAMLMANGTGAAYGVSANVVELGCNTKKRVFANYEVAPNSLSPQTSRVSVHNITPSSSNSTTTNGFYFHTNVYRRMSLGEREAHMISAMHRAHRIQQLTVPQTYTDIVHILGDTSDTMYPIYRQPQPSDDACTAATAVFDVDGCTLDVYTDNPSSSAVKYKVPLPCTQCWPDS